LAVALKDSLTLRGVPKLPAPLPPAEYCIPEIAPEQLTCRAVGSAVSVLQVFKVEL
jgi:hypothetical protein